MNNTTRYLCAAAHLDSSFRNFVIEHLEEEVLRAPGPAADVELDALLEQCHRARMRQQYRDLALVCLLVATLAVSSPNLISWWNSRIPPWLDAYGEPNFALFGFQSAVHVGLQLAAWLVVLTDTWLSRYRWAVGNWSRRAVFNAEAEERATTSSEPASAEDERVETVVYNGFSPFVGAGYEIGGWSFAINLNRKTDSLAAGILRERNQAADVSMSDLYEAIAERMAALGLPHTSIRNLLLVDGGAIRDNPDFLPHPLRAPVRSVPATTAAKYMERHSTDVRYCQCIRVGEADGEMLLSTYVRIWKCAQSLYIACNYCVLPPVQPYLKTVDRITPTPPEYNTHLQKLMVLPITLIKTPFLMVWAPFSILGWLFRKPFRWIDGNIARWLAAESPTWNYGASTSIRERQTAGGYESYLQRLDNEMTLKVVERHVLDTIVEFLDARGIDTTEIRERRTTILNEGVIQYGGAIQTGALAVGRQSHATGRFRRFRRSNTRAGAENLVRRR